jgi:hypothetical protein
MGGSSIRRYLLACRRRTDFLAKLIAQLSVSGLSLNDHDRREHENGTMIGSFREYNKLKISNLLKA